MMVALEKLWKNYPEEDPYDAKNKEGGKLFSNQCAIRLSHAMKKTGVNLSSFPKKRKCWVHGSSDHILAAIELADWLETSNIPNANVTVNITGHKW